MAAAFPEMRRLDENGESWQQGSKGERVVVCTDCTNHKRHHHVWITQLSPGQGLA